jgi:glycosyltransferase involved in cell wall biosynthesis
LGILFQDLMGAAAVQSGIENGGAVARVTQRVELGLARRATRVAIVSPRFRDYLEAGGVDPARIDLVPNWSRPLTAAWSPAETRARFGWGTSTVVVHGGNIGLKQGLEQVVAAARVAADRGLNVRFVLVGDGSQRADLEREAAGLANVSFLGIQSDPIYAAVLRAADVLLLSERSTTVDMSLPSKLTSYFAAGRPVVAAVHPDGATAREVERSGAGVVVPSGDADALLASVEQLRLRGDYSQALADAGPRYASVALDRERALGVADGFVGRVLGRPSPALEAAA